MQVVHLHHPGQLHQGGFHHGQINPPRHRIEGNHQRFLQHFPAAVAHGQAHADCRDGIQLAPAREPHHHRTHQDGGRNQGIGHQVHHRCLAVEVVAVVVAKQPRGDQVDRNARSRCRSHREAGDRHGIGEALDAFHHQHRRRHQNQQGIQ